MKINVTCTPNLKKAGFTLVEVLVSIGLMSIMAGIGISLFAIINSSYERANTISNIQSQGSSVMEQVERSIRSASSATTSPSYGCPSGVTGCLSLTIPSDSIEFQTSNCEVTEYSWTAPTASTNGRLQRTWRHRDGSACTSPTADLFDTSPTKGVSVELVAGQSSIFTITTSASSPDNVVIAMNLLQGVSLKPASAPDTRSQVPFITTISLREYTK